MTNKISNEENNYKSNGNLTKILSEKYRPIELSDIIGQNEIISMLQSMLDNNYLPNLILYGHSGTGKTTTALSIAKKLFGNEYNKYILEINGWDDRGINIIRNVIKGYCNNNTVNNFINNNQQNNNFDHNNNMLKYIILDEADSLTEEAQIGLHGLFDWKYVKFCIICNYLNKIIPWIKSNSTILKFKTININTHNNFLKNICINENIDIDDNILWLIYDIWKGDLRYSLNILQLANMNINKLKINEDDICKLTKNINNDDFDKLIYFWKKKNFNKLFNFLEKLIYENNINISNIFEKFINYVLNIIDVNSSWNVFENKIIKFIKRMYFLKKSHDDNKNLYIIISSFVGLIIDWKIL